MKRAASGVFRLQMWRRATRVCAKLQSVLLDRRLRRISPICLEIVLLAMWTLRSSFSTAKLCGARQCRFQMQPNCKSSNLHGSHAKSSPPAFLQSMQKQQTACSPKSEEKKRRDCLLIFPRTRLQTLLPKSSLTTQSLPLHLCVWRRRDATFFEFCFKVTSILRRRQTYDFF